MKLKTLFVTVAMTALLSVTCPAQGITVSLNGNIVDFPNQQPVVVEGRTLIPLRGVFDNMGYTIGWNGDTKTVTLTKGSDVIVINIGESCYYLNNQAVVIDVPAQIINGSTMLPLRAIADATGCEVLWDNNTKIATIIDKSSVSVTPQQGVVIAQSQQEADYINSYTSVISEYNKIATEFLAFCQEINTNGFTDESQFTQLNSLAKKMYSASNEAKNKLSALSCPSKYLSLNNASVDYMKSMADLSKLYSDFIEGSVSPDEFAEKLNTVATDAMMKEAEYKNIFAQVVG